MIRILSLGAGVQSSTLALMYAKEHAFAMSNGSHRGIGRPPDAAIFADTGGEPAAVYKWLDWLEKQLPFPIYRVARGNLWEAATRVRTTRDGERSYVAIGIPVHTVEGLRKGIGMRQCTKTFKIDPIERKARELTGMKRITKKDGVQVQMLIGISLDEYERMKPSRRPWIEASWPLIDAGMSRADCLTWMERNGYPLPPRSACTYCPFHSDDEWLNLTDSEFADAVQKEKQLQDAYEAASAIRSKPYFHRSRVPLDQVKFKPTGGKDLAKQLNMFRNECAGMCGV